MTCIIALKHKNSIYMGGDCAGVAGYRKELRSDQKVFIKREFIMGFTTSFRMGQLLQYSLKIPARDGIDLYQYMVTNFVNAVRDCLKEGGYASKKDENEIGGCFLVGIEGRIFKIESDYQVGELYQNFAAIGCGEEIALGAMAASKNIPPHTRILDALTIVETYCTGVSGPFTVIELEERGFKDEPKAA